MYKQREDFAYTISDNMAIDSNGNLILYIGNNFTIANKGTALTLQVS